MKAKYLSHAAACALAKDYGHLVGQAFDPNHTIHLVVTGPYSRILQWGHVSALLRGRELPPNPKERYDALVVALNDRKPSEFVIQDLRSYLDERGMGCDLAKYKRPQLVAASIH